MRKKIPVVTVAEPPEAARLAGLPLEATIANTWTWNGNCWTEVASAGPSARSAARMDYNPNAQINGAFLFGGKNENQPQTVYYNDSWLYRAGQGWTLCNPDTQCTPLGPPAGSRSTSPTATTAAGC